MRSPLRARLKYYGFAIVQVDPCRPIDPQAWQVPGLQAQVNGSFWPRMCCNCQPFSTHSMQPVVANTMAALLRIRKSQKRRPLILCQTAYEPVPGRKIWRELITRSPLPFLVEEDPGLPLRWLGRKSHKAVNIWLDYPRVHPLLANLLQLQKDFPQHDFWLEEHGGLAVQFNLFHSWQQLQDGLTSEALRVWSAYLKSKTQLLEGPWLVLGAQRRDLALFRSDLLRLWGPRFYFLDKETPPFNEAFGRIWVLKTDRDIRLSSPNLRGWPVLHLGGNHRQRAYRHVRVAPLAKPTWVSLQPLMGETKWQLARQTWCFQRSARGWHLPLVAESLPSMSQSFEEIVACFGGYGA